MWPHSLCLNIKLKRELHIGYYYLLIKIKLIKLRLVKISIKLGLLYFYLVKILIKLGFVIFP
jgi:hypothetical protein